MAVKLSKNKHIKSTNGFHKISLLCEALNFKVSLLVLLTINILNSYIFWLMWGGFYSTRQSSVFIQMAVFQLLITMFSFVFYSIRNKRVALKLIPSSTILINHALTARRVALAGAFGLATVNFIVGLVLYSINGSIDIWATGNPI